jgi:Cu-Zn family superoxide dismutase
MMKKIMFVLIVACLPLSIAHAREVTVTMHALTASGVGDSIGVVVISETENGLRMTPYLQNMQPGDFMFSINENVGCHSQQTGFDTYIPGMAAGRVLWQMPNIRVSADGQATQPVEISNVRITDLSQRSLVISSKANPTLALEGFQTQRIACGSLEHY